MLPFYRLAVISRSGGVSEVGSAGVVEVQGEEGEVHSEVEEVPGDGLPTYLQALEVEGEERVAITLDYTP